MQIRECYESFGGDFEDAKQRILKEELVHKFALKFLDDKNFSKLTEGLKSGNYEAAFRAAHSLKGVSQNLSFRKLGLSSSLLTEELRQWETAPVDTARCEELYRQVSADYEEVVAAVGQLEKV